MRVPLVVAGLLFLAGCRRAETPRQAIPIAPLAFVVPVPEPGPSVTEAAPAGVFATPEDFCTAQRAAVAPALAQAWPDDAGYPGGVEPSCTIAGARPPVHDLRPPFLEVAEYAAADVTQSVHGLLVRTSAGWSDVGVVFDAHLHDDPGCGHAGGHRIEEVTSAPAPAPSRLLVRWLSAHTTWLGRVIHTDEGDETLLYVESLEVCRGEGARVVCDPSRRLARTTESASDVWPPGASWADPLAAGPRWSTRSSPQVAEDGSVTLGTHH